MIQATRCRPLQRTSALSPFALAPAVLACHPTCVSLSQTTAGKETCYILLFIFPDLSQYKSLSAQEKVGAWKLEHRCKRQNRLCKGAVSI